MRVYVLTQEEPFYIPGMLEHLLARRRDVIGIGLVPGELRPRRLRRYLALMGPRDFALQSLRFAACRAADLAARLVPLGRSFSVAGAARRHGLPCERVASIDAPSFVESLRARAVDLIVSIACPRLLGRELLALPRHGCINVHGALLPRYQGLLPSFWVLAKGEPHTGVTVHLLDEGVDGGAILLQRRVAIRADDTVHSLVERSKLETGKHLLVEAIDLIERGEARPRPIDPREASRFSFPDAAAVREFRARGRRFV